MKYLITYFKNVSRTKLIVFVAFLGMQVYEIFKYVNIDYTVPLSGVKFNGDRYHITYPIEVIVWYIFTFLSMVLMMLRIYELERTKDNFIMLCLYVFLLLDMLFIFNKPYGWVGFLPICTDLIIGLVLIWLIIKDKIKNV